MTSWRRYSRQKRQQRSSDPDEHIHPQVCRELALFLLRDAVENLQHLNNKSPAMRKYAIDSQEFLNGAGNFNFWIDAAGLNPAWFNRQLIKYKKNLA